MNFIDYNKNYLSETVKRNRYILTKEMANHIFNQFANYANELKDVVDGIKATIYQTSGNTDTYFVNVGDGTVVQKTIEDIIAGIDGYTLNKIPAAAIADTCILQVNNNKQLNFIKLQNNSIIKGNSKNLIIESIKKDDIAIQASFSSIFKDNSISFAKFNKTPQILSTFAKETLLTDEHLATAFRFTVLEENSLSADNFFYSARKGWDYFIQNPTHFEDTELRQILHLMITPKSIKNGVRLQDMTSYDRPYRPLMLSPFWSIHIKSKTKKMHNILKFNPQIIADNIIQPSPLTRIEDSNVMKYIYFFSQLSHFFNDIRDKKPLSNGTNIENLEIESCGTFEDNLFTNDLFVNNIGVSLYAYIGPMYIDRKYLNPTFKINKRMCYESIYADFTKKHGRPALQKENVPEAIVNRLRTHFGVIDSDWDWDGVFN
jgi:hypothetical protein